MQPEYFWRNFDTGINYLFLNVFTNKNYRLLLPASFSIIIFLPLNRAKKIVFSSKFEFEISHKC